MQPQLASKANERWLCDLKSKLVENLKACRRKEPRLQTGLQVVAFDRTHRFGVNGERHRQ